MVESKRKKFHDKDKYYRREFFARDLIRSPRPSLARRRRRHYLGSIATQPHSFPLIFVVFVVSLTIASFPPFSSASLFHLLLLVPTTRRRAVAKEQGYRSRAAFKLTQINRKFSILQNARTVLDLCAAPGGWTQVCSRSLPTDSSSTIVAVDILPIRPMRNVISLLGDITTEKCKAAIRATLQGAGADVVLCDGAPNVGASYDRDAYEQNELALHALKCATEHLRKNGTFVTKLYRSRDYSAYLWVAKQFFRTIQAVKPTASRSQSAEIFLVCTGYVDPDKIAARMFDPKCVFEQVDGQATGGGTRIKRARRPRGSIYFTRNSGRRYDRGTGTTWRKWTRQ